MKFNFIDKVEQISAERIVTVKTVTLAEEYLADHFPTFPVLPGVLMLEVAIQAAGWLLHERSGFARSLAVLKEARNVKYGSFVAPGNALRMEVDFLKSAGEGGTFKVIGTLMHADADAPPAVQARLELAYFDLAQKQPELADLDLRLKEHNRRRWDLIAPKGIAADVAGAAASI